MFQHTAARRRLRAKINRLLDKLLCFNTQPHEGGCLPMLRLFCACFLVSTHSRTKAAATRFQPNALLTGCFNTQPHEGGCKNTYLSLSSMFRFNTQPHEGGCHQSLRASLVYFVSTHSRTKAAAGLVLTWDFEEVVSTHSRTKAAASKNGRMTQRKTFQHTAARRRLRISSVRVIIGTRVSTHSRTKAAAKRLNFK